MEEETAQAQSQVRETPFLSLQAENAIVRYLPLILLLTENEIVIAAAVLAERED